MSKLVVDSGKGTADIGEFFLEMTIDEVEEDGAICIDYELLDYENCWHAQGSFNPDAIDDLIEALTIIKNHFGIERPKGSMFLYSGEPGQA